LPDWIIYYDDGRSFTSDDGPPEQAPKDGVQVVALKDIAVGKILWHGYDYYCWHKEGCWIPHTETGMKFYLSKADEPGIVINGYWIPPQRWTAIYNAAVEDSRLPFKTGIDPREKAFEAV
jgi:hypothetical protein